MANGIRTSDPCGFYKGRSSTFHVGSRVRQTPEEGRRKYRLKRCGNKDEDNSPKTLNNKNHQASSQIFRQRISICTEVVALVSVPSLGQIELFDHLTVRKGMTLN